MNRNHRFIIVVSCLILLSRCGTACAFTKDGCGDGSCVDCHTLSKRETASLLSISEEQIVDLKFAGRKDIAKERFVDLNRVDVSRILIEDALEVSDPKAPIRIVVFDDPQCPIA